MHLDRRLFLSAVGGAGVAALLADWSAVEAALLDAAQANAQTPRAPLTTLSAHDASELEAMAERILPATETPGARDLGVIVFMDRALGGFMAKEMPTVRRGVAELRRLAARRNAGAPSFAALSAADQDAVLGAMEKTPFFGLVRLMTMVGAFGNPSHGGNRDRQGWAMLGFEPASTHVPPFGYYDRAAEQGGR